MAASEPSSGRDAIESRPSPVAVADQLNAGQINRDKDKDKGDGVRTALLALGATALSNVGNILKELRDVIESVAQLQQFVIDHLWISAIVLGLALVWGNVLLFRFLYKRLHRVPTAYRVLAGIVCAGLVALMLVSNLFSLRTLLQGQTEVEQTLASELLTAQDPYEGGFKNALNAAGYPDPWTTAQSVKAVLLAGNYDPERIKHAFTYIEAQRRSEGFQVYYDADSKSQFIRTETAAWVAIAYLESLSRPGVWQSNERQAAIARTESALDLILAQQDHNHGGWSPIPNYSEHNARTYATMMAVWALTEAMLSPDIDASAKQKIAPAFDSGIAWLINHYSAKLGWEENPRYRLEKPFPGLTYQLLFVLERAQHVNGHNAFANTEAYKQIKREFRNTINPAEVSDLKPVPTEYNLIGGHPCAVDVLAYPWLLSVLPVLIEDQDVPSSDRRYLRGLLQHELGKAPNLPNELLHAETWQVAEDLMGISNFIAFGQKRR
jgi:hypothetical protein